MNARLTSTGLGVNVVRERALYPPIEAGEHSQLEGNRFIVAGNQIVIPGSRFDMLLILSSQDGFVDTAYFELQVGEPHANAPQGPDGYGYACFDDTDRDWDLAPEYDWIEISLRENERDHNGTLINFEGRSPSDIGETRVIDLGFITQFYGEEFNQITVATNGFISIGDQAMVTNFQNWPLDRCIGGGVGMMAPFWDNLRFRDDQSGVYYYLDEENRWFIVEWYKLGHREGGNAELTFQVILYDKRYWITATGDPKVVFQYKSISNARGNGSDWANAVPYASVGISSPDGTTGISYSFNNQYPVTSALLENRRAILFATSVQYFRAGYLHGRVTDFATGRPIPEAMVYTNYGFSALTDADGYWFINDALAEVSFNITASKLGYNDSTYADNLLDEDDTLVFVFALLHPEFVSSTRSLSAILDPGLEAELPFNIRNTGNGPLEWLVEERLIGDANAAPWEFRRSYLIGDSLNDNRLEGVVFTGDLFYMVGANIRGREDDTNMVYVVDREGSLVRRFAQFNQTDKYGMKDLAWDGDLIWGSGGDSLYGFTCEGELRQSFPGPYSVNTALAWDSDRGLLWVSSATTDIVGIDREGNQMARFDRRGLFIYGLAYWPDDPDGYPLYIFHSPGAGRQVVHKMNPEMGDTLFVRELFPEGGGTPGGAFATNQFDVYSWVFMNLANAGSHDRVDIWQLDARRDWFRVRAEGLEGPSGVIDAGASQDFVLRLNSTGLPDTLFESELLFWHNAGGGRDTIGVALDVIGPTPPTRFDLLYPADGDTLRDTTAVSFGWERSLDYNQGEDVTYVVWFQTGVDSVSVWLADTSLTVELDSLGLALEWGSRLEWWVQAFSGEDVVDCNARFGVWFMPNVAGLGAALPVEFGLQRVYPSPFNSQATIRFGVDRPERTVLKAYDLLGREVVTLFDRTPAVGYYQLVWDASHLPSGLYILRLESAGRVRVAKIALVR